MTKVVTIETANPAFRFSQQDILGHITNHPRISEKARGFYRRFLADPGIATRHFAMDTLGQVAFETPDQSIARFQDEASRLGVEAANRCLKKAGVDASQISGLIVTTCTGYLCPGLTSYISQGLRLNDNIYSLDLAGIGCAAALPAIRSADLYLKANPGKYVLVVSVEICSAALSWGDEIDLILSNCIFADGAAACLLSSREEDEGFALEQFHSVLWPEYRDELRFKNKDSRLANVISRKVPVIAAQAVRELFGQIGQNTSSDTRTHYAFHTGGRRILDEIQSALSLDEGNMTRSREILRDYGNMSSPSCLFVLKNILENDRPQEGDRLVIFSFGAGFSAFAAQARYSPAGEVPLAAPSREEEIELR